jgi:predicted enzyme related to lactoylglutathione lyase
MQRVIGLGGIFFRAKDPAALREWYRVHLGMDIQSWGGCALPPGTDKNAFCISGEGGDGALAKSAHPFVVNYRVADLHGLVAALRAEGCAVDDEVMDSEYGKFGWVTDPEGHRIELWEPPKAA